MANPDVIDRPTRTDTIKLHGPEAFEGMRRAGRLAAECLDLLVPEVKPGVLTGKLDETLDNLADYLDRELETRSKVVSALSYPGVVMVMALVTVVILAGYVLPQFNPLFEELDADLPAEGGAVLLV